jgi:aldose 1-epimerase
MRSPTGTQYELAAETPSGAARAVITELAAGIRLYTVNGIDLVEPFPAPSPPPMGAGIVLVPWPNRVRDGAWMHDGTRRQLALTEPARQNAIHGLLRYTSYREVARTAASVTLAATVYPQSGYPFQLDTEVTYVLLADGLEVAHTLRNVGSTDAPVAVGAHPYLRIGDVPTGDLVLRVDAETHIDVDERLNPVGESAVAGTRFDLRAGRRVGELNLDDGYSGVRLVHGRAEHALLAPDGRELTLWGDENMGYVQVFTPHNFPEAEGTTRQAVAVEPMTAPANALNSGEGLRWLAPGEEWVVRWGIRHAGFDL